jgi:methylmalonyl-CoA mutase N-terminal domain/subunit
VAAVADPLGGSHYVEALTDRIEEDALRTMAEVDEEGGAVAAIESGWMQRRIAESAYRLQRRVESGERVIVGQNRFSESAEATVEIMKIEPRGEAEQCERVQNVRAERDGTAAKRCLERLAEEARGTGNLLPPLREALAAYCTIGECCDQLRGVFGEYRPSMEV